MYQQLKLRMNLNECMIGSSVWLSLRADARPKILFKLVVLK